MIGLGSIGGYGALLILGRSCPMVQARPLMLNALVKGLSCFACGAGHDHRVLQTVCTRCGMPLRVNYQLRPFRPSGPPSLWRYAPVLPVGPQDAVTLCEGLTPLLPAGDGILIKD